MSAQTDHDEPLSVRHDAADVFGEIRPDGIVWHHAGPASQTAPAWTWDHLDLVNARARSIAVTDGDWTHAASHILAGPDETPRILACGDVVAGVLPSDGCAAARLAPVDRG